MDLEIIHIRIQSMRADIIKALAANAANAGWIEKSLTAVMDRLEALEEDLGEYPDIP